jgi:hypothetical protein
MTTFSSLVRVVFEHDYYGDRLFQWLTAAPSPRTAVEMRKRDILFRQAQGGFSLFFNQRETRSQVLAAPFSLRFHLALNDPDFYNYTDLSAGVPPTGAVVPADVPAASTVAPADAAPPTAAPLPAARISQSVFLFYNMPGNPVSDKGIPLLHGGPVVASTDLCDGAQVIPGVSAKPFGILVIDLGPDLPECYGIRFSARSTHWSYILVSDHLRGLDRPAIIDTAGQESFTGPRPVVLPDNRDALSFTSLNPIALRFSGGKRFKLVEQFDPDPAKSKVILGALPLPGVSVISHALADAGAGSPERAAGPESPGSPYISEILLY